MKTSQNEKPQQHRFVCENCKREVFLQAKYCDNCGGEIEWPKEIKKIITTFKEQDKKNKS